MSFTTYTHDELKKKRIQEEIEDITKGSKQYSVSELTLRNVLEADADYLKEARRTATELGMNGIGLETLLQECWYHKDRSDLFHNGIRIKGIAEKRIALILKQLHTHDLHLVRKPKVRKT